MFSWVTYLLSYFPKSLFFSVVIHLSFSYTHTHTHTHIYIHGFPCGSAGKESACNAGDPGSIPGSGRSPEEGIGYPLQYSGLENSMDCIVYGVAKSQT